jgi:hypothetical protein
VRRKHIGSPLSSSSLARVDVCADGLLSVGAERVLSRPLVERKIVGAFARGMRDTFWLGSSLSD